MRSRFVDYPRNSVNSRYSSTFLSTFIKNTFGRYRKCDVISRKFFYYRRWDDVGVWVIIANIVARHEETPILNFVTNIILRNASFTGGFCEFLVLSISQSTMYVLTLSFHTHDICSLQNRGMQLCKFHKQQRTKIHLSSNDFEDFWYISKHFIGIVRRDIYLKCDVLSLSSGWACVERCSILFSYVLRESSTFHLFPLYFNHL